MRSLQIVAPAIAFFFPLFLWATACSWKPQVLFFGGYGASQFQVDQWARNAQSTYPYSENYDFKGISYQGHVWGQDSVVARNQSLIRQWVNGINSAPAGCRFVLVGHSSGSAISNAIAAKIKDKTKAQLIVLDGFIPRKPVVATTCWSVRGALNTRGMSSCPSHYLTGAAGCGSASMCRHFALVNKNAGAAGVNENNYKSTAYSRLQANLDWLAPNSSGTSTAAPRTGALGTP